MADVEPKSKNLADLYKLAPLAWSDVHLALKEKLSQAPGTGGPNRHTFWLSTADADGRPHVAGVGAHFVDDHYYFTGSPQSRKIKNIERDPRCSLAVATKSYDLVLEGGAVRITDEARLQFIAEVFTEGGWSPTVSEGGFVNDYSAPSAGPPPWFVYEFTPKDVYALRTTEPGGATRFTL